MRAHAVVALAVTLLASSGSAQSTKNCVTRAVGLGDGTVNAARLKPYDNAFTFVTRLENGESLSPGIWTDQLRIRTIDGRQVMVRTQSLAYYNGRVLTSVNVFDPVTFAPISGIINNPDRTLEKWTFTEKTAEVHSTGADGRESVRNVEFAKPAYDFNCCMRSLIPAALPLRVGAVFALPGIVADEGDPDVVTFRVLKREKVKAGYRGMIDAWVVQSPVPGGGEATFWIADTAPYLVHMTLTGVPANKTAEGLHYDQSYDMIG
ncbi:DUF3108 domain-containing protein [Sphingomonas panacisoli]|uniref:DUF3108 domain-containing protein n=1 Tax=Sphingomonas panacisoli TaxID=1813879 RepID=A0A5B8LFH9_9SPHN|nr:DUF3108 domain-containing protein [Sphingomonas panacisoli]QDZ06412.1 DUF3108 domain-containing protein [Sphingomonas panacisoli]